MNPLTASLAAVLLLVVAVALISKPHRIFMPVVLTVAAWQYLKALLLIPVRLSTFLYEATGAKTAEAHYNVALTAAALWEANTEFRPAAREIFRRVLMANGIRPGGVPGAEINLMNDPGSIGAVIGAAAAVNATAGKKIEATHCRCTHPSKSHDHRAGMVGACNNEGCPCAAFVAYAPVTSIAK